MQPVYCAMCYYGESGHFPFAFLIRNDSLIFLVIVDLLYQVEALYRTASDKPEILKRP